MTVKGAAWFGTLLCVIALVMSLDRDVRQGGGVYAVFFSFLPVVFFAFARQQQASERTIAELTSRIRQLEAGRP